MAHWRDDYLAALAARDQKEKAHVILYDAYARLADRTGKLATSTPAADLSSGHRAGSRKSQRSVSSSLVTASQKPLQPETETSPTDLLNATRADLSEAQRSRAELQDRLNQVKGEVEKLRKKNTLDGWRVSALESERVQLKLRLKDRDEELRGKAKLLEDFQDEMATLNLQLNMAEERSSRLQRENKDLVDRWMARMGQEADAMNDASKFS